jgi:hypothetical protein
VALSRAARPVKDGAGQIPAAVAQCGMAANGEVRIQNSEFRIRRRSGLASRKPSLTPGHRRVPRGLRLLGSLPYFAAWLRPKRAIVAARKETKI